MPSRNEMGLLRGLGQGLADVGKLGFVATLQEMRDERLAKIEAQAAEKKWARDKELLSIKGEQDRENASFKVDEEVRGKKELSDYFLDKGLAADGSAPERSKWEVIEDGMGAATGLSDGKTIIDFNTSYGKEVKKLIDSGVSVDDATAAARVRMREVVAGDGGNENPDESPGLLSMLFGAGNKPKLPDRNANKTQKTQAQPSSGAQAPSEAEGFGSKYIEYLANPGKAIGEGAGYLSMGIDRLKARDRELDKKAGRF